MNDDYDDYDDDQFDVDADTDPATAGRSRVMTRRVPRVTRARIVAGGCVTPAPRPEPNRHRAVKLAALAALAGGILVLPRGRRIQLLKAAVLVVLATLTLAALLVLVVMLAGVGTDDDSGGPVTVPAPSTATTVPAPSCEWGRLCP